MPRSTLIRLAQINLNGLCSKVNLLSDFARSSRLDIVCITESHLLQHVPNSFVQIPNYTLVRNDVNGAVYKHGVCAYVSNNITLGDVSAPIPNILTFHLVSYNVFVVVVYRPPSNSTAENEQACTFLRSFCADKEVILMGDFNLPGLDWINGNLNRGPGCSTTSLMFAELFDSLGLTQWVTQPTYPRSGNTLDLVLTSEPDRIGLVEVSPPLPGCDHCPTSCDYVFDKFPADSAHECPMPYRRAWNRGHYARMRRSLQSIDWDLELACLNADDSFNHFAEIISELINVHVPMQNFNQGKPPWKMRPPTSLIHRRKEAWQTYKRQRHYLGRSSAGTRAAYKTFSVVNRELRSFAVRSQCNYESSLIDRSQDNPKLLHSYIRNKKVGRPTIGPLLLQSRHLTDDPGTMAELFAASFASVFTTATSANYLSRHVFDGTLSQIELSHDSVYRALQDLDSNSAMGPDKIHPHVLKTCAKEFTFPLQVIFRRSLREGRLPSRWKSSLVIPIYKKGSRFDPLNYRPISLTSVVCKTMERLICTQLRSYLETNSLLNPNQFGFRSGRSTIDQLLLVYNTVSKNTDLGGVTDVILFDFSKAFDVVCHDIMISKLKAIGLGGSLLDWISSFLHNGQMQVCVKDAKSQPRPVTSGVPQGSVLGPLLFLVYIDSIASQLCSEYKIFADDLKLYACVKHAPGTTSATSTAMVQRDIDTLQATAASWCLKMNPEKCVVLRFARPRANVSPPQYFLDGQQIPHVDSHRDLGVTVDSQLKFHDHIRMIVNKASGLTHSFLKSTVCRSPAFMLFLLTTHIRPILEYCSCLWHTGYILDLRALENVQRRWTKRIDGMDTLDYANRLRSLNLYSVQGRLIRADMIQCWKIFNGKSCIRPDELFDCPPQDRTRGHRYRIFPTLTHTDIRKRSFSVRCITLWNTLPEEVVCAADLNSFKRLLREHVQDSLFAYE